MSHLPGVAGHTVAHVIEQIAEIEGNTVVQVRRVALLAWPWVEAAPETSAHLPGMGIIEKKSAQQRTTTHDRGILLSVPRNVAYGIYEDLGFLEVQPIY